MGAIGAGSRIWLALALAAAILAVGAAPLRATDMMLEDTGEPPYTVYGWTFAGLTLVSLGVAVQGMQESRDELDEAERKFKLYRAATTQADAILLRRKTERSLDRAERAEARANLGILFAVLFAVTSFYSFSPGSDYDPSILVTLVDDRLSLRMKF